ncbi:unnamed protein product, partial [marine sediment metagenome]
VASHAPGLWIISGDWYVTTQGANSVKGSAIAGAGIYEHVMGTYDGTNLRVIVNGSLVGGPTAKDSAPTSEQLVFGAQAKDPISTFCNSKITQVRIWDVARTPAQALANMNNPWLQDANIVGSWRMDRDSSEQLCLDVSGNGNHLTMGSSGDPDANEPEWIIPAYKQLPPA